MMYAYAVYEAETGNVLAVGKSTNPAIITLTRKRLQPGQALYEGEIDPNTTCLPGGVPAPKRQVARIVTKQEVKAHAARLLSYSDWYVTRAAEGGDSVPHDVQIYRQAVRDASGVIEAMTPIPADYLDAKYWPDQL